MNTDLLLSAFRSMLRIRTAEEMIAKDYRENKIYSFFHASCGQEAVAVGVCMALTKEDRVFGNHRSHGHMLAKGGDLYSLFAEIYGKADGCCKGKGGSMHPVARDVNFMGSTPLLGAAVPLAVGSAFEQKASGSKAITVVFFGDGASEEGVVYESMNLAALWKLPIVFVLEDNLYSVASPEKARRPENFNRKLLSESFDIPYRLVDGNEFGRVYVSAKAAVLSAKEGIPSLLHCRVFRQMAHSGPIMDEACRTFDTEEVRRDKDCIRQITGQLIEAGIPDTRIEEIRKEVEMEVVDVFARAKAAKEPGAEELLTGVYA